MARPKSPDPKSHLLQVKVQQDIMDAINTEWERLRKEHPALTINQCDAIRSLILRGARTNA